MCLLVQVLVSTNQRLRIDIDAMNISNLIEVPVGLPFFFPDCLKRQGQVLAVDVPEILTHLRGQQNGPDIVVTRLDLVGPEMLRRIAPHTVIAPLMRPRWDITDLSQRLEAAEFCGKVLAVSEPLPRAELVLRELRNAFPSLDISLLEVASG